MIHLSIMANKEILTIQLFKRTTASEVVLPFCPKSLCRNQLFCRFILSIHYFQFLWEKHNHSPICWDNTSGVNFSLFTSLLLLFMHVSHLWTIIQSFFFFFYCFVSAQLSQKTIFSLLRGISKGCSCIMWSSTWNSPKNIKVSPPPQKNKHLWHRVN